MDAREKAVRQKLKDDLPHYATKCLKIRTKSGEVLPFIFNEAQLYAHQQVEKQLLLTGRVRAIICKGRQQGMSTYIGGRFYWKLTHRRGVKVFILTHDGEATNNLFDMTQRYHQYCPPLVRPTAANQSARELYFDGIDSGYKVGTAGNKAVGRSSTIQFLHGSEVAYWPNAPEHAKGVLQAVPPNPGTEIFLESTANGIGNYFHEQWQLAESGMSDFIPIFVPWYWQSEYRRDILEPFNPHETEVDLIRLYGLTADKLLWRRYKIQELSAAGGDGEHAFHREYPNNAIEAFSMSGEDTLIHPDLVMHARKNDNLEGIGPLVVGCDPARFGDDRTSIIYRRGRRAYNLRSYTGKDTMEVAGIVHKIITTDMPDMVCIDVGGLGAGVVDRLFELGHKGVVIPINSGESALDGERYVNKRAELWGNTKEWLMMKPVQIPDSDSLHADLCSPKYSYDSLNRLKMEPKEQMKKRGLRSPDEADALCLTLALPFNAIQKNKNQSKSVAQEFHSAHLRKMKLRMDR